MSGVVGWWVTKGGREKTRHEGRGDNDDGEKTIMMMTTMRCVQDEMHTESIARQSPVIDLR